MSWYERPANQINAIGKDRLDQLANRVGFEVCTRNPDGSLDYLFEFKNHGFKVLVVKIPIEVDIEDAWLQAEKVAATFVDENGELRIELFEKKEMS